MNIKPVVQSSTLFLVSNILVLFYKVNISSNISRWTFAGKKCYCLHSYISF